MNKRVKRDGTSEEASPPGLSRFLIVLSCELRVTRWIFNEVGFSHACAKMLRYKILWIIH